jgi:hypothetical protein
MPTVLRIGPYRFGFFSADRTEPPHVHVRRDRNEAKFWLEPEVRLARAGGFADRELNVIGQLIVEHREYLLEQWHDHFGQ